MHLSEVPKSSSPNQDLSKWSNTHLYQHYKPLKFWVELVVVGISPKSQFGKTRGVSLLYPMDQLFEKYVYQILSKQLQRGITRHAQHRLGYLATHKTESWFKLLPDIVIKKDDENTAILDTKWKRLDSSKDNGSDKYGLSQSDFYQLFAYAHRGLGMGGEVFLIYPRTKTFRMPLPEFDMQNGYKLHVVPFDLETDRLIHESENLFHTFKMDS